MLNLKGLRKSDKKFLLCLNDWTELRSDWNMLLRLSAGWKLSARPHFSPDLPDRMKKMPETKARMVRCGRMCPMLLMTKAVKTKSNETIGKGVAVRTISAGARDGSRIWANT